MSTADSVLLSLSSILAKDFLGKTVLKRAPEEQLTRAGKWLSWGVVVVLVGIALSPGITLWGLTELKMDILVQVSPLFVLGVWWRRFTARAALGGILAGTALTFGLVLSGYDRLWGLQAGLYGWGLNLIVCAVSSHTTQEA
jgi:SSS family solute:Na+ symporter/sodium/pantothenate symporter